MTDDSEQRSVLLIVRLVGIAIMLSGVAFTAWTGIALFENFDASNPWAKIFLAGRLLFVLAGVDVILMGWSFSRGAFWIAGSQLIVAATLAFAGYRILILFL